MSYPAQQLFAEGTNTPGIQWMNRQGVTTWDHGTITGFGVPPAGSGWTLYRGRVAFKQTGSGTSGGFYKTGSNFAMYFPQTRVGGAYDDDTRCWRVLGLFAFDGAGLGAGDIGLEVGPPANYDFVTGLTAGYRLAPTAAGAISVQVRQTGGAGLTVNQVVAAVDVNDWHAYEMRFIGGDGRTDGSFKAFIDGVQVFASGYGAGTLLPSWANGTALGYQIAQGNRGAAATYLALDGLQVAAATTEPGLL